MKLSKCNIYTTSEIKEEIKSSYVCPKNHILILLFHLILGKLVCHMTLIDGWLESQWSTVYSH